jgi:hypothetical protein
MNFLSFYEDYFIKYFTEAQLQTLKILLWLLSVHKQVRIERLAACFPLPVLYESRRKHIQRFLMLPSFSLSLLWFPLIKSIIYKEFKVGSRLIITLDRTQWKDKNVFLIAVIWKKHALPIYWHLLDKRGASNLAEQKALIRPVLRLLKSYQLVLVGDREFHSVKLADWLQNKGKRQPIFFTFRQKQGTNYKKTGQDFQSFSDLGLAPGMKLFLTGVSVTKEKGFGEFNVAAYWKRKYKGKQEKEPWFILTNLSSLEEALNVYRARTGIEALFKDCKTGGYNLEDSKANNRRLTSLILLIAMAYTATALKGQILKKTGQSKYVARLQEKRRVEKRHSDFWVGLYGSMWIIAWDFCLDLVEIIINRNSHHLNKYQKGLRAMSLIEASL